MGHPRREPVEAEGGVQLQWQAWAERLEPIADREAVALGVERSVGDWVWHRAGHVLYPARSSAVTPETTKARAAATCGTNTSEYPGAGGAGVPQRCRAGGQSTVGPSHPAKSDQRS